VDLPAQGMGSRYRAFVFLVHYSSLYLEPCTLYLELNTSRLCLQAKSTSALSGRGYQDMV
jgi:hypothetical protein